MAKRATQRLIANRYALQTPLGRGGMGVVWRAQDTLLRREVAIKEVQLPPSLGSTELASMRARVMREARAAARLNHPGAVTLYDVVQEEGQTFIVMELVDASTLAHLVRERGPLPPDRAAAIGLEILDALQAAHRVGIVHRDVKPGNVMVTEDGRTKLADFGIAFLAGDPQLTSTGLVLGSPSYMAPEQANGEPSGPPTDLWALGATMYYAVEGEPPFERQGTIPTLTAVVHDPPRRMRRAGALAPVIMSLLAKSPADRPSAAQLQRQLERVATAGQEATASHPTLPAALVEPPPEDEREVTAQLPTVAPIPAPGPQAPAAATAQASEAPAAQEAPAQEAEGREADSVEEGRPVAAPPAAATPPAAAAAEAEAKEAQAAAAAEKEEAATAAEAEAEEGPEARGPSPVDGPARAEGPSPVDGLAQAEGPAGERQAVAAAAAAPLAAGPQAPAEERPTARERPTAEERTATEEQPVPAEERLATREQPAPAAAVPAPLRPAPSRPGPSEPAPSDAAPWGAAPWGAAPSRPAPSGAVPSGPGPERPVLPLPGVGPGRSRRGLLLAAALLAVVGVLAAFVLPGVLGDRGQRQASAPPATTRAPGTTGGATGTSEPATSGAPSTTGAPTTTKAPSTPARRPGQVPPGWKKSEHPGRGFALAVPDGWRVDESKVQVNFRGPESDWEFFVQSKSPANDLEQAGGVWEDHLRSEFGNDGLRFLSKGFGQYQGKRAYILEYTYRDKGGLVHERDVNVAIGRWGYSLVFHAPDSDWARFQDQIWTGVEWSLYPID